MTTAAFVLASVGEEAGFKNGWGRATTGTPRSAPTRPAAPSTGTSRRAYPTVADLNAAWKTNYQGWDEVKLTKEFSGRVPALAADGWRTPRTSPLGAGRHRRQPRALRGTPPTFTTGTTTSSSRSRAKSCAKINR